MLKIPTQVTVRREVHIRMPKEGSGHEKHVCRLDFRIVSKDEQDALQRQAFDPIVRNEDETDEAWRARNEEQRELIRKYDRELMGDAIIGWPNDKTSGLADDDGNPLPFSEDNRDALLNNPIILAQLSAYYRDLMAGKNGVGKS